MAGQIAAEAFKKVLSTLLYLSMYLSVYTVLSIYLPTYLSIHLSIYLSIYLFVFYSEQTISLTTPSMYEYQLESHFEHSCRLQGAQRLSFVPVVAGGDRGCSLHYTTNEQKLRYIIIENIEMRTFLLYRDGELVLMDAGAEYFGYVSDITRTWPVNGSFNGYQTELYEAVLRIKDACIEVSVYIDNVVCTPTYVNLLLSKNFFYYSFSLYK